MVSGAKREVSEMFRKSPVQRVRKVVGGREERVKDINENLLKGIKDVRRRGAEYFNALLTLRY